MAVTLRNLLPLIRYNDVRLLDACDNEICLLRKQYLDDFISEKFLNMEVDYIENEEEILDTINIHLINELGGQKR